MNEANDNRVLWTPQRWLSAECYLRRLIDVHDFKRRELLVLHVVLMRSYGMGRPRALFERLEDLHACTRISRGNVSEVLNGLRRALVLDERPSKWYGINPNAKAWKVVPRLDLSPLMEQIELLVPDADLRDGMDAAFLDDPAQFLGLEALPTGGAEARQMRSPQARESRPGVLGGYCESSGSRPRADHAAVSASVGQSVSSFSVPESGTKAVPNSETGQVFPNRERCVNQNKDGPDAVGSRIGNGLYIALKGTAVQSSKAAVPLKRLTEEGVRLRDEVRSAVGEADWINYVGYWINRIKENPEKVQRVLGEFRYQVSVGQVIHKPGGYMFDLMKRWH